MKKLFALLTVFTLSLALVACGGAEELPAIPEDVDMETVDDYLGRPDVQYVDLRNFDDKMSSGYVEGFEFIPFFDYLEYENILVRTDGDWEFAAEDIQKEGALKALYAEDKTIFLMCGSGTRAGYVKAALDSLGYSTVLNIGGIADYTGDALVFGDGSYTINMDVKGDYTPGTYFGFDPVGNYMATVVINEKGGIADVILDAISDGTTKQNLGFNYGMVAFGGADYEWFEHANMIADTIVANQGWDGIVIDETTIDPDWNALDVPHHFITIDNEESVDGVANATIGAEGFVLAWNAAISQASESDLGVVDIDATPAEWATAHEPAFDYVDGEFSAQNGKSLVTIRVEDGFIVDVFIDALSCTDDNENGEYESCTTKQVLKFDYGMVAFGTNVELEWFEQANMLADAIVEAQTWAWTLTEDDYFDQATIDDIGGVTIHVDEIKIAVENALDKATAE